MGRSRTKGRKNTSHATRLAAIAEHLNPARPPWWVDLPGGQTPAQGWYWIGPGASTPSFLGHNHIRAELALEAMIDALG